MSLAKNKLTILIPIIVFLIAFGWRLWGINSAGETWDESAYYNAGKQYLRNIKNLDFNPDHWDANKEHPPIAKYIYGLVSIKPYLEDKTDYTPGRIASALMGALTILLVYLIGKNLFSQRVGILAALILSFMPYFVGFNKIYGLDTPTVLFFTITIWLFLRAVINNSNFYYFSSAIFLGLSIGVRPNNLLLYPLLFLILILIKGKDFLKGKDRAYLWHLFTFILIPALILFISWPWLWSNTIGHLNSTIGHWPAPDIPLKEIFLGQNVPIPYSYYFIYFLVTTPVLILILIIPFLIFLFKTNNKNLWILLFWLLVPFLWTFATIKQDGIRYILMIYPTLALIAAYSISLIKEKKTFYFLSFLLLLYLISINIKIHPYYIDYYNELVNGPKKVYEKKWFQIGWWGEGLEEATTWLNQNTPENSIIDYKTIPDYTIGKLRSDLKINNQDSDFIVINTNSEWYQNVKIEDKNYQIVYEVKAMGAPLVKIYKHKND